MNVILLTTPVRSKGASSKEGEVRDMVRIGSSKMAIAKSLPLPRPRVGLRVGYLGYWR